MTLIASVYSQVNSCFTTFAVLPTQLECL